MTGSLFDHRAQASRELRALPLRRRLRVYLGGVNGCERWIAERAAYLAANDVPPRGRDRLGL